MAASCGARERRAQTGLGILYENGWAVPRDEAQAVAWYRKASDQGDAEAEYRLGERYVMGWWAGSPHDIPQGFALLQKAAAQGHVGSMRAIADYYRQGMFGVPKDESQAFAWYRKAADLGDAIAETRVAAAYQFGTGVAEDMPQANLWYRKAEAQYLEDAKHGDVVAQSALGNMYEWGEGTIPVDKKAALYWYRKAAEQDGPLKKIAESDLARVESEIKSAAGRGQ